MVVMNSSGRDFNLAQYLSIFWLFFPLLPSFSPPVIAIITLCHSLTCITDPEQGCLLIYHLICPVHINSSSSRLITAL